MKKIFSILLCALLSISFAFAQESEKTEQSFWLTVDFAEHVATENLAASGTNWAPITGPYSGIEGRITPWYEMKLKTPGSNALTAGNNVKFQEGLEITPVSLMVKSVVKVEPIAFLNFSAGTDIGTGWDLGPFKGGIGVWNGTEYASLPTFQRYFIEPWAEGLFQFDVAALISDSELADKMHIVMQATYKVAYSKLTGVADGTPWIWQLGANRFNGWNYDSVITLGYSFPSSVKVLSLAGVQTEFWGYYKEVENYAGYNTSFTNIGISPTLLLKFNEHHSLAMQCRIMNRRSFADVTNTSFSGLVNGTEWLFDRIAFSYTWSL